MKSARPLLPALLLLWLTAWPSAQRHLAASAASLAAAAAGESPSCDQVRAFLGRHAAADAAATPSDAAAAAKSGALLVCESREACCTPAMEASLQKSALRDFRQALNASSRHLRLALHEAADAIQGQMLLQVTASQSKTLTMFGELYKRVARLADAPLASLFADLRRFVAGRTVDDDQVDVADSVQRFFDDLFPRLYGRTASSASSSASAASSAASAATSGAYADCLRSAQVELRPFGEIPRRLANSLSRSLDASRALILSLELGASVLNATDHAELNDECRVALLRATHCAQCRGHTVQARPCRGLCSNVARGCLAGLADVDQPWNEWVDAMERLTSALVHGDLGARAVLSSIDSRLSEAVLYALENGPILEKKAKRICGDAGNASRTDAAADAAADADAGGVKELGVPGEPTPVHADLKWRLDSLLPILSEARGFYAHLPDAVCVARSSPFASHQHDTECWNGQRFGEYTKPISGIGIGAQKYNAEVKVSRADVDVSLVQLSDKLRHVRQVLISKTVAAPEPDSLVMADFGGSGSGDGDERRGAGVGVGRHHGAGGVGGVGGGHHHNYNQHHSASPSGRHGDAGWAGVDAEPDAVGHRHGSSSSSTSSSFSDADAEGSGASGAGPSIGGDWNENDAGSERGHDAKKPGTDDIELVDANPERKADKKSAGHRTPPPASLASLAAAVLLGVATLRLWG